MAAFLPSAHAPKRAVAAFGEEAAPILRLNMVAGDVQATWKKHATRKLVKVNVFLCVFLVCVLGSVSFVFQIHVLYLAWLR